MTWNEDRNIFNSNLIRQINMVLFHNETVACGHAHWQPSLDSMIVSLRLIILFCWRSEELSLINTESTQREAEGEMHACMHTASFRQTEAAIDLNRSLWGVQRQDCAYTFELCAKIMGVREEQPGVCVGDAVIWHWPTLEALSDTSESKTGDRYLRH